jgi:putative ABC transport system permease protein
LGKYFKAPDSSIKSRQIVGIVRDAKYAKLRDALRSTAYIALTQEEKLGRYSNFEIRAAAGQPASLIPALKSAIAEVNPDVALQFTGSPRRLTNSSIASASSLTLSGVFGALALLLARSA